jgi:hypothetical protein
MSLLILLGLGAEQAEVDTYLRDVGALLHARTNSGGTELGTFDENTRPTGEQVIELIEMAVGDLEARVPVEIPAEYKDAARRLVALQAATLIEASYFPNELETDRSAYRQYQAMYLNGVESLVAALTAPTTLRLV